MKLVVRVQYIGDRARLLLREDQAAEYTKGLIDDLEVFGFPVPHEQKPIQKSGFMLCVWHVERDSDTHHAIQNAFIKAKAEAASLLDRSIRYISLNEDGLMHTTSLANKPYKPKTYNKPEFQSPQNNNSQSYNKPFGKAPKYPTTISQARKAVTPLTQRITGAEIYGHGAGPSGPYVSHGSRDVEMLPDGARTPPAHGSEGSSSVIDVTQQTLLQLSQSSAFQSLLQRNPSLPTPIKMEPAPPSDLSLLLQSPAQPQMPNLQALLEKAGVKSSSAQAFLSAQNGLSGKAIAGSGTNSIPVSGVNVTPVGSLSATALGTPLTLPVATSSSSLAALPPSSGLSSGNASATPRPNSATTVPISRGHAVNTAMRDLWNVRRQLTALQAQENSLIAELQRHGQNVPPKEGVNASEQRVKILEDEIAALRDELNREQQSRRVSEALLRAERVRRVELESTMKDTTRECKQPFVVPALLDAFMKIGQMTGDALKESHSGTVPMEL